MIFRILGLFAFAALLFASTRYHTAVLNDTDVGIALGQPAAKLEGSLASVSVQGDTVARLIKKQGQKKLAKVDDSSKKAKKIVEDKKLHIGYSNVADTRECIADYMLSQVGVREKTNKNDGLRVYGYFRDIGWKTPEKLKKNERYWCGAFMGSAWLHCMEKVPFVKSKAELAQVRKWENGPAVNKADADTGDAVTLKGYSHVQGVYERHPNPTFAYYTTVTANSSPEADDSDRREGVFKKTALWRDVKKVISLKKTLDLV